MAVYMLLANKIPMWLWDHWGSVSGYVGIIRIDRTTLLSPKLVLILSCTGDQHRLSLVSIFRNASLTIMIITIDRQITYQGLNKMITITS